MDNFFHITQLINWGSRSRSEKDALFISECQLIWMTIKEDN